MESIERPNITVQTKIDAPIKMVWKYWTTPEDIVKWNNASAEWHTTLAHNDLRDGGNFNYRMEAKDGSIGFDFEGVYAEVIIYEKIKYTLGDGRKVKIVFSSLGNKSAIVETFEAESLNSIDLQRSGWQSILDNFRKYSETSYNNKAQ